ncbi:hypothetical protein I4U23_000167 [Adineta vaga]|nr:hypothetical protein I4U23_000167 [Adineta vaga]
MQTIPCCPRCSMNDRVCKWKDYLCVNRANRAAREAFADLRSANSIRAVALADDLALLLSDLRIIARIRARTARDRRQTKNNCIGKRTKFYFFKLDEFSDYFICDFKH